MEIFKCVPLCPSGEEMVVPTEQKIGGPQCRSG